jgi:Ni/Fe-hydrogenase subunit HybB-like protein
MILVELFMARFDRRPPRIDLLADLGKYSAPILALYLGFKMMDLLLRPDARAAFAMIDLNTVLYIGELILGAVVPLVLLLKSSIRNSALGLGISAALMIIFGGSFNRLNVSVIAVNHGSLGYAPNWIEYALIPVILVCIIGFYVIISRIFLIYQHEQGTGK